MSGRSDDAMAPDIGTVLTTLRIWCLWAWTVRTGAMARLQGRDAVDRLLCAAASLDNSSWKMYVVRALTRYRWLHS